MLFFLSSIALCILMLVGAHVGTTITPMPVDGRPPVSRWSLGPVLSAVGLTGAVLSIIGGVAVPALVRSHYGSQREQLGRAVQAQRVYYQDHGHYAYRIGGWGVGDPDLTVTARVSADRQSVALSIACGWDDCVAHLRRGS